MANKFSFKVVAAAAVLLAAAGAQAGPFYLNIGTNYGPGTDKVNATSTSVKDRFSYIYQSQTRFKNVDGDSPLNGIEVGDTTVTNAGYLANPGAAGNLSNNNITGFSPNQSGGGFAGPIVDSNNGYGSPNWQMTFGITGLTGTVSGFGASPQGPSPELVYNAGAVIKFYLFDAAGSAAGVNFMNVVISGGFSGTGGTFLKGKADFTGLTASVAQMNLFNAVTPTCNGLTGFYDIWAACGAEGLSLDFDGTFNTNASIAATPSFDPVTNEFVIGPVAHNGDGTFAVSEPGALALLGMALLGAGFASRRRKSA